MESKKSNKIREIVRLQQILRKWRKLANSSKTSAGNNNSNFNSSKSIKFLKRTLSLSDNSVRDSSSSTVPKGYLAVCVGEELKRFIIPTDYLSHQAFHILLREAEEEFGFHQTGVLRIPCEVAVFESILKMVEDKNGKIFMNECWLWMIQMGIASQTTRELHLIILKAQCADRFLLCMRKRERFQ